MRANVFLQVTDHLLPVLEVLNREENGHGNGEEGNQSYDNLKSEALIKLNLSHRILQSTGS